MTSTLVQTTFHADAATIDIEHDANVIQIASINTDWSRDNTPLRSEFATKRISEMSAAGLLNSAQPANRKGHRKAAKPVQGFFGSTSHPLSHRLNTTHFIGYSFYKQKHYRSPMQAPRRRRWLGSL
ncbi:MAG: hypothetical protein Q4A11_05465 [Brachymonas sp.]|nr:hypothetical protein [Brachymonas sp.]